MATQPSNSSHRQWEQSPREFSPWPAEQTDDPTQPVANRRIAIHNSHLQVHKLRTGHQRMSKLDLEVAADPVHKRIQSDEIGFLVRFNYWQYQHTKVNLRFLARPCDLTVVLILILLVLVFLWL